MSFLEYIFNLLKAIFGIKEETKKEETFNYAEASKKLTEGARNQLLWGHQVESEKASILSQVDLNEAAGHTVYIIDVNSCYYKITRGTFAQYRKGSWTNPEYGMMAQSLKDMLLLHHTKAEKESILKQIEDHEAAGTKEYSIAVNGGLYKVKNNVVIATM